MKNDQKNVNNSNDNVRIINSIVEKITIETIDNLIEAKKFLLNDSKLISKIWNHYSNIFTKKLISKEDIESSNLLKQLEKILNPLQKKVWDDELTSSLEDLILI